VAFALAEAGAGARPAVLCGDRPLLGLGFRGDPASQGAVGVSSSKHTCAADEAARGICAADEAACGS